MLFLVGLVLAALTATSQGRQLRSHQEFDFTNLTSFPKDFIWSTATASYQVEGAWNVNGKGENIWDRITHTRPGFVANNATGDVACDSYHKYKEDVKNIKNLGFNSYRFSLSWSRLFPKGYCTEVNEDGVRYYNALIDELLANGIQPMITLYHWDLPQPLQDIGGWLNRDIAEIFADYARNCFKLFGDKVKWWTTINEPQSVVNGYGAEIFAPALNLHGTGEYESGHNLLRAHARAYHIYDKEFRSTQGGKVSIALSGGYHIPKNQDDSVHVKVADRANQFTFGWFGNPIFSKEGDYPKVMREVVDKSSKAEGRSKSRLPYFTPKEIEELKGTFDYIGINHYSSVMVEPGILGEDPSFMRDMGISYVLIPPVVRTNCDWEQVTPTQFREFLNWMKGYFGDHEILITENGYCGTDTLNDVERINYTQGYLRNLLLAMKEDNVKIIGYTVWSLMDNFEWRDGYTKTFGVIRVDFNSPDRTRTVKLSGKFIKKLIEKNKGNIKI